jgi:hypothetical protein
MGFHHQTIDADPPCGRLGSCEVTDLTGNGRPDVVVTGMGAVPTISIADKEINVRKLPVLGELYARTETYAFWYENPGWERHDITSESNLHLDVGATLYDIDGDGRTDLLAGQGYAHNDVYWFQQPADPRDEWTKRLVTDRFQKYHDLAVGDVDNDGAPELVGLSQRSASVFYYDIPDDPTVEPWPDDHCTVVDDDNAVEGIYIGDVDGDGANELLAGTSLYRLEDGRWTREQFAADWEDVRVAVGDINGDGRPEVVLSEGDSPKYGTHPGRVGWFDPHTWEEHVVAEGLYCPHSLQLADFTGDGVQDIFVGEMGLGENELPTHYVFSHIGDGKFESQTVSQGIPTHEAKAVDLDGDGRVDIVGKSYEPNARVDAWLNSFEADVEESERADSTSRQSATD